MRLLTLLLALLPTLSSAQTYNLRTPPPVPGWGLRNRAQEARGARLGEPIAVPRTIIVPTPLRAPAQRFQPTGERAQDSIGPRDYRQPAPPPRPWSQEVLFREMEARQAALRDAMIRPTANTNGGGIFPTPGPANASVLRRIRDDRESVSGGGIRLPRAAADALADYNGVPRSSEPEHKPCPGGATCRNIRAERWSTETADSTVVYCRSASCGNSSPEVQINIRSRQRGGVGLSATVLKPDARREGYIVATEGQNRNGSPPDNARSDAARLTRHLGERAGLDPQSQEALIRVGREAGRERIRAERDGTFSDPIQARIPRLKGESK